MLCKIFVDNSQSIDLRLPYLRTIFAPVLKLKIAQDTPERTFQNAVSNVKIVLNRHRCRYFLGVSYEHSF